jgi:hypothetical protein
MDLDCPHLSLAPYWADKDDDRRIVLVRSLDALRLCRGGAYQEVSAGRTRWNLQDPTGRLPWGLSRFAIDIGLTSPFRAEYDDRELVAMVGERIMRGDLVGLRQGRAAATTEADPTLEQRHLARAIESQSRGRLSEGGRQYTLVAGADVAGNPDRNSYEVVRHDEALRVLAALATKSADRSELAALFGKARDKLSPDWRPPLAPNGLVLLRRLQAPRVTATSHEAVISPSQMRAMMETAALEIHVVDLDGKPQEGLAFKIVMPDGGTASGKLDKDGCGRARSATPGVFVVTFPELDGADWDGDGALELPPEEERSEASRHKATAEDRIPAIARDRGFLNWRTVWEFAGNADLKSRRENPNVLWDGDEVTIPSKVRRTAEVPGGTAEYVVHRHEERIVNVRLLDTELTPLAGIRYQAKVGAPDLNHGLVPDDGFITLEVPPGADQVVVSCYLSEDEDDPPLDWEFDIQEDPFEDSHAHKVQRLINLGFAVALPEGEEPGDDSRLALARYRACVENHEDEDDDLHDDVAAVHEAEDSEEQS